MSFLHNGTRYRLHTCPLGWDCKFRTSSATQSCGTSGPTTIEETVIDMPHTSSKQDVKARSSTSIRPNGFRVIEIPGMPDEDLTTGLSHLLLMLEFPLHFTNLILIFDGWLSSDTDCHMYANRFVGEVGPDSFFLKLNNVL